MDVWLEAGRTSQPRDIVGGETQVFQVIQGLLQSRRDQKSAARRQGAAEQFEHGRAGIAMIQIGLDHIELVEVGEQCACFGRHYVVMPDFMPGIHVFRARRDIKTWMAGQKGVHARLRRYARP
jgi:hypothetical protein